ncbi:MAG: PilZ domain-containing protein [Candidatus Omnitrophica bacterium]|nr:PilZ domain-containing protein [Candidatus Omnitrophota bacterium]
MDGDRRSAPRVEKPLMVKYSLASQNQGCWDSTTTKDISRKGILLHTRKSFPKGEKLKILIKIPFDPFHWMEIEGKVVDFVGNYTRIEFIGLGKQQEQLIQDYVEWAIKHNLPKKH